MTREDRRAARRRRVIRNRIILGLVIVILIAAIIFLCIQLFGGDDSDDVSETAATETTVDTADQIPPVISGAADINIYVGDTVSYKSGITVTDNADPNPQLTVDASAVNLNVAGTYRVTYTATDASSNSSFVSVNVIVSEKETEAEATEEEIAEMKSLAKQYLKQIVSDDMTAKEKALRIWLWVNWNCDYVSTSDKSSWVRGAIQYYNTHKGDCFNYYAAARGLLEAAGIETKAIVKSDTSHSSHYWCLVNLGDGWYHFDATPRDGSGDFFFLVTDEQLDGYSEAHENSHIFDHEAYPERATQIITDLDAQPDYYDYFEE